MEETEEGKQASVESRSFNGYKVDVWALGVTMFACLFGRLPFPFVTVLDICDRINRDECVTFPPHLPSPPAPTC